MPSQKCKAKSSRTGEPCKRYAIAGGTVCPFHGGNSPQVKDAAKRRLLAMVDPAMAVIERCLSSTAKDVPAHVALKAATEVLDRARLDLESEAPGGREFVVRFVKPEASE